MTRGLFFAVALWAMGASVAPAQLTPTMYAVLMSDTPTTTNQVITVQAGLSFNTEDIMRYTVQVVYDSRVLQLTEVKDMSGIPYPQNSFNVFPESLSAPYNAGAQAYHVINGNDTMNLYQFKTGWLFRTKFKVKDSRLLPTTIRLRKDPRNGFEPIIISRTIKPITVRFQDWDVQGLGAEDAIQVILGLKSPAPADDIIPDGLIDIGDVIERARRLKAGTL